MGKTGVPAEKLSPLMTLSSGITACLLFLVSKTWCFSVSDASLPGGNKKQRSWRSLLRRAWIKIVFYFCLFQAKLRLEMAAEHNKNMVQKDLEAKDEEIEQFRFNMQKKVWTMSVHFGDSDSTHVFSRRVIQGESTSKDFCCVPWHCFTELKLH